METVGGVIRNNIEFGYAPCRAWSSRLDVTTHFSNTTQLCQTIGRGIVESVRLEPRS